MHGTAVRRPRRRDHHQQGRGVHRRRAVPSPPGAPPRRGRSPIQVPSSTRRALLESAKSAVAEALADCPPGPVGGLGVASLAESGVLLDRRGESVAPVIAWHDTRDHAEFENLRDAVGAQNFSATTGLPMRQQWSLTKHRWLIDNIPSARNAVRRLERRGVDRSRTRRRRGDGTITRVEDRMAATGRPIVVGGDAGVVGGGASR